MSTAAVATPVEKKTFFCLRPHYQVCIKHGENMLTPNGKMARLGEKHLEFSPTAGPDKKSYGVITTSDPDKLEWLERQIANGNDEIMTMAQFQIHTTPAEERAAAWERIAQENKRQLGHTNQLLEDLKVQNPEVYKALTAKQKR